MSKSRLLGVSLACVLCACSNANFAGKQEKENAAAPTGTTASTGPSGPASPATSAAAPSGPPANVPSPPNTNPATAATPVTTSPASGTLPDDPQTPPGANDATLPTACPYFKGGPEDAAPVSIRTQAELQAIEPNRSYRLENDVALAADWAPISLTGVVLDGAGHAITGAKVTIPADAAEGMGWGVFTSIEGSVLRNVRVGGAEVRSAAAVEPNGYAGVLAGTLKASCLTNVTIENGTVVANAYAVGGLAGKGEGVKISKVRVQVAISRPEGSALLAEAGSLGGLFGEGGGEISDARITAGITSKLGMTGGVAGNFSGELTDAEVHFTHRCGTQCLFVGGVSGWSPSGVKLTRVHAKVDIDGDGFIEPVAGLVGFGQPEITDSYADGTIVTKKTRTGETGGLVGRSLRTTLKRSYAAVRISGSVHGREDQAAYTCKEMDADHGITNPVGPLVATGLCATGTCTPAESSYWNQDASTCEASDAGTVLSNEALAKAASFAGWDFEAVWVLPEGATQPALRIESKAD